MALATPERNATMEKFRREMEERENAFLAYLATHRERVREECGNEAFFEHGTHWCAKTAATWAAMNDPGDSGRKNNTDRYPGWSQFMFIRDNVLSGIFGSNYAGSYPPENERDDQVGVSMPDVLVVGEHTSKSVRLPVMQFVWRDIMVTTRFNYHDWKVAVQLPEPVYNEDLMGIVTTDHHLLHSVYFEGFPKAYIYPPMSAGDYPISARFSTVFGSQYKVYTFFWMLKKWYDRRFGPANTDTED